MIHSTIMPTYYSQLPIAFTRGKGVWLWDTDNKKYLDSFSGIAVCNLGHSHPEVTKAIAKQAKLLLHTSNNFHILNQEKLADKLTAVAGMEQAYFCNSGAEANEAALKLTRAYARKKNLQNPIVLTMKNSFHGRTFGALSASGLERLQAGFEPILSGFKYVTLNDTEELKNVVANTPNIIAIMLEPVQGDGGVFAASESYLRLIRGLCDQHDWLMILDEVQTGIGRTGTWFAYQHFDIKPDILTNAKALANGLPVGVCMARGKACNLFAPGKHGTTFGGTPIVCATGLTVLETIERDNILQHAQQMGDFLLTELKQTLGSKAASIRNLGMMFGVELGKDCLSIPAIGLKHQILLNVVHNNTVRLLPALIINEREAKLLVKRLNNAVEEFYSS
jgi:acetylornithine/N-succinyldiaminopimelate aminotransferase